MALAKFQSAKWKQNNKFISMVNPTYTLQLIILRKETRLRYIIVRFGRWGEIGHLSEMGC